MVLLYLTERGEGNALLFNGADEQAAPRGGSTDPDPHGSTRRRKIAQVTLLYSQEGEIPVKNHSRTKGEDRGWRRPSAVGEKSKRSLAVDLLKTEGLFDVNSPSDQPQRQRSSSPP